MKAFQFCWRVKLLTPPLKYYYFANIKNYTNMKTKKCNFLIISPKPFFLKNTILKLFVYKIVCVHTTCFLYFTFQYFQETSNDIAYNYNKKNRMPNLKSLNLKSRFQLKFIQLVKVAYSNVFLFDAFKQIIIWFFVYSTRFSRINSCKQHVFAI